MPKEEIRKLVRDKWVMARIKVTKAGKILAKVAPAALGVAKKRATAKKKKVAKKRARR